MFVDKEIDTLLFSLANSLGSASEMWPLKPGQFFPYVDLDLALSLYKGLQKALDFGATHKQLGKVFKYPGVVRDILFGSGITGLKVANKLKIEGIKTRDQILLVRHIIAILKTMVPNDPFCINGTNLILDKHELSNFEKEVQWQDFDNETKVLIKDLTVNLFTLFWALYWYYPCIGLEVHGPYELKKSKLLIKDYHDISPIDIWPNCKKLNIKNIRIAFILKDSSIKLNFGNILTSPKDIYPYIEKYALYINNQQILNNDTLGSISSKIENVSEEQIMQVNSMTDFDKIRKGAEIAYYEFKNFFDFIKEDWKPNEKIENSIKILGDKFIKTNKNLSPNYTSSDRIKMFDPRNDFLP